MLDSDMFSILFIFYTVIPTIFILKIILTNSKSDSKLIFTKWINRFLIAIAIFSLLLLSQSATLNKTVSNIQNNNQNKSNGICPEISKVEYLDKSKSSSTAYINACGRVYSYLNKNAMIELKYKSNTYAFMWGIG
jgi:hypothetical protein